MLNRQRYEGCLACYPGKIRRLVMRFLLAFDCQMSIERDDEDLHNYTDLEYERARREAEDIFARRYFGRQTA